MTIGMMVGLVTTIVFMIPIKIINVRVSISSDDEAGVDETF